MSRRTSPGDPCRFADWTSAFPLAILNGPAPRRFRATLPQLEPHTLPMIRRSRPRASRCGPAIATLALLLGVGKLGAQVADAPPDTVAGIPVNYTEALVGAYTLPDPLVMRNGTPVRDAAMWETQRRPELVRLFEEHQYGRAPGRPEAMIFEVLEAATPALGGTALRRQVTLHFDTEREGPPLDLLVYLPPDTTEPAPLLVYVGFSPNPLAVNDSAVRPSTVWDRESRSRVPAPAESRFPRFDPRPLLQAGIGVAFVHYASLDPDFPDGMELGIRGRYLEPGQAAPRADEWGAIAAWSWGLRRVMDYLETDAQVDHRRVALFGTSRVGKTVLWTAARDPRYAAVIASASGEGGAALSRRNYGETVAHLTAPSRYAYQFAGNYARYADQVHDLPVDAHLLLALIAPRPVMLQTGTEDRWSDPVGEFEAAVAATPVYRLLGGEGLKVTSHPPVGEPVLGDIGYLLHEGGHGPIASDWPVFIEFLKLHLTGWE